MARNGKRWGLNSDMTDSEVYYLDKRFSIHIFNFF